MVLVAVGLLLLAVGVTLAVPWWLRDPEPIPVGYAADQDQEQIDLVIERESLVRSLKELEIEHGQGRLMDTDYARLKATDERRLLQVLDRIEALAVTAPGGPAIAASAPGSTTSRRWLAALGSVVLVLVAASSIYAYIQWKQARVWDAVSAQAGPTGMPDPRQMVARLEERLRANPNDLEGQIMAGRSYMALERLPDAQHAWTKVIELDPRNHEAHYNLGVVMINTRKFDDPELFKTALGHFDRALVNVPMEPAVNWYRGLALWYLKRYRETEDAWSTAAQNLPPGSEDAEFVKSALVKLRAGQVPF
ncbi:MAG: tetratricopeptide repeat protein [Nitrospirota bacterium]